MSMFVEATDEPLGEAVPDIRKTDEKSTLDLWAPSAFPNTLLNSNKQSDLSKIEGLEKPKPEFISELIPAILQKQDFIVSYFSQETIDNTAARKDYVLNLKGYEDFAGSFGDVYSLDHEDAVKRSIDRQRENEKIIGESGALGVASSIALGFVSPGSLLLLPLSGGAGPVLNAFKTGNVLRGALLAARTGAIVSTIDEVALHASQETREFGESVLNISGATFLSGVIGGSIGLYKSSKIKSASKQIEDFMELPKDGASDYLEPHVVPLTTKELETDTSISAMFGDDSVGAARTSIAENKIKSTRGLEKLDFLNPVMEVMTSKEIQTRKIGSELFDNPFIFQDNAKGIAKVTSVEGDIRRDLMIFDTKLYTFNEKAFSDYTGSWQDKIQRKISGGEKRLNRTEFAAEFDVATRNGDRSSIPQVQELAKNVRVLTNALGDAALKHKVNDFLPDSPIGAETWGMRVWDKKAMNDQHERLSDIIFKDYREGNQWRDPIPTTGQFLKDRPFNISKIKEIKSRLKEEIASIEKDHINKIKIVKDKKELSSLKKSLKEQIKELKKKSKKSEEPFNVKAMDDLDLRDLTLKTINNMKSMPDDVPIWNVTQRMGVGKARKFRIPDNLVLDFFVQDPVTNLSAYARKVTTLIHLKKRGFDPEGFAAKLTTIKENVRLSQFKQIEIIKAKFSEKIKKATSKKESDALLKQEASDVAKVIRKADKIIKTDVNNLTNIMSRIDGTAQLNKDAVVSASKVLTGSVKTLNYSTMLGNVVASSISDVATPMLINGTASVMNDSLVILAREMTTLSRSMRKMRGDLRKRAFQELRDIGYAKDLFDSSRISSIMGLTESYGGSKLDVVNQGLQKYTGTLSLINWWNAKMKMFTGYLAMARILRLSKKAVKGDLNTKDIEFLGRFHLDEPIIRKINEQFLIHGEEIKGRFASGMTDWDDMEAFRSMHAAIDGFVEQTILTPRQEKPFFMDTEIGSVVFQFTNFPKAAFSKILIAGVQQNDMKALSGYISLVAMGALTVAIKNLQSGRDMPATAEEWIKESIDKSGALGHLFSMYDLAERMTGIFKDIGESSEPISTASAGRIVSGLAGPSFSFAKNAVETGIWTTNLLAHGESPTEGNLSATRRMIPFQNTLALRNAFDLVGNVTSDFLGAKPSRKKSKSKRRNR